MSASKLAYAEVPSFYASVERLDDPGLRARPVVVGGSPHKRGRVQSASPEALSSGVVVGMETDDVAQVCPDAVLVRTNMKRYREISSLLHGVLREVAHGIEVDGLAGAYLELSAQQLRDEGQARALAQRLCERVRDAIGLPLRVGIAPVKFLAKVAAHESEPFDVRLVDTGDVAGFLSQLPLDRLPGVGPKTQAVFEQMSIETVGQLLARDPVEVEDRLGSHGRRILAYARGEDEAPVRTAPHPKSLSHEFTFEQPEVERSAIDSCLARLCQTAENSLRPQRLCAGRVAVKLRYAEGETTTRTRTLSRPVLSAAEMHSAALRLLDRTEAGRRPLHRIGIALTSLGPEPEPDAQLDLFGQ
ncbi:MAG: DNA polymerase IV [bacterium]|nr:DNA polymerase IV [bacterium]